VFAESCEASGASENEASRVRRGLEDSFSADDDDDLFINTNRPPPLEMDSDSSSSESDVDHN